ncbi:MAG TPA: GAF and ANTAR domain-containing protein [Pilimelia sp.]|nr:GAF and ANTAR domain-containing protein [Pilimelia sp.]
MPSSPGDLATTYGRLLTLLADSPEIDAFLDEVVHLAADVVTPAAGGGITLRRDGAAVTVATSHPLAAEADEIQYGADEGPCLTSLRTGEVVRVDDLTAESRWDRYRPHAVARGVLSSLSLPLAVAGHTAGAMNLYSRQRDAFTGPVRAHAAAFAAQCAAALTVALRMADDGERHRQLVEAMAGRSVIDQALGILMAQQRCTASAAFDLLRRASQRRNRRLREIAADVIRNVTGEAPEPPPRFGTADRRNGPDPAAR